MHEIRFDDLDGLNDFAQYDFGPWGPPCVVDQESITRFAELTGDRQWIHTDVERARRESPYGDTVAHGFLILSLLPMLQPLNHVRITGHASATQMGARRLRFLAPVVAGSILCARSRLLDAQTHARGMVLCFEFAVHVVGQEKPALLYEAQLLYRG